MGCTIFDAFNEVSKLARVHRAIQCTDGKHDTKATLDPLIDSLQFSLKDKGENWDEVCSCKLLSKAISTYSCLVALFLVTSLLEWLNKGISSLNQRYRLARAHI